MKGISVGERSKLFPSVRQRDIWNWDSAKCWDELGTYPQRFGGTKPGFHEAKPVNGC